MTSPTSISLYVVAAFYKFTELAEPGKFADCLAQVCREQQIRGTILLASEGINGTIAGTRAGIDAVLASLRSFPNLSDLEHKESYHESLPFDRMKVRLKEEIVTLGIPEVAPPQRVGKYISPHDWNDLLREPGVTVIDTRNHYEYAVGKFTGAWDPQTENFREFPAYVQRELDPGVHKKVAMYCTGGIRCEKATALMLQLGFEEVYHLRGGILKYLEEIPLEESLWEGECFVFDDRVTVDHHLKRGGYELCRGCGLPVPAENTTEPERRQSVVWCGDCCGPA